MKERWFASFDWDAGNRAKCVRHGVSITEIEAAFERPVRIFDDDLHSQNEPRFHAIGTTPNGRYVFLVFTVRVIEPEVRIRPISARFMHRKEIEFYESQDA